MQDLVPQEVIEKYVGLREGLGAEVSVTDNLDNELTRANIVKLKSRNIAFELGRHSREFIKDRDMIVVSPGLPDSALPVVWAEEFKIPIISEIEVAAILCPAEVIAVTGTSGKTTVTTLIGRLLQDNQGEAFVCGNIGNPFCACVAQMEEGDFVSLEVSSFQLERIKTFKPKISVILNFSRNHLDRYKNMQEYIQAKKRIFMNQDASDYLVLNCQDPLVKALARETPAKTVYFSKSQENLNPNQSAVMVVASILGIGRDLVMKVFREFKGIEHRLEFVKEINNIKFINDSKATTVDSAVWALKNITCPVILIAGGRDKGSDYSAILDLMAEKVKEVILIGEAKAKMKAIFMQKLPCEEAANLEEAVVRAFAKASSGDCVLLSPMCSSFDMFSDYEERGREFKKAVSNLTFKT